MSHYLNLSSRAWRSLCHHWRPPLSGALILQRYLAGPVLSCLDALQTVVVGKRRDAARVHDPVMVLGYWRSGTTLLHRYLCLDPRFGFASNHACMNPQHFLLTEEQALRSQARASRPMDDVEVSPSSPEEDEFALLCLGARSPYEALLVPSRLEEALRLSDPRDMEAAQAEEWRQTFLRFLRGISFLRQERPLVLKSPGHGYRVATLRDMFPEAHFILIVRDPWLVFESVVRMWRSLFELYALENAPDEERLQDIVLADRLRFEDKLQSGLKGLPPDRVALVRYEELVRAPLTVLAELYERLGWEGFAQMRPVFEAESQFHRGYRVRTVFAPTSIQRVAQDWADLIARYGYGDGQAATP